MPILRDKHSPETYIDFSVIKHDPRAGEGGYYTYQYVHNAKLIAEVQFGWTNMVMESFIPMLKEFPQPKWNGYFSHFEENMEVKWLYEYKTDQYLLILMDSGYLFTLKTSKEAIQVFGQQLEQELKLALPH